MAGDSRKVLQKCQLRSLPDMAMLASAALLFLVASGAVQAAVVDRIAAVVQSDVITVSEVDQMVQLRILPRTAVRSDDDYRKDVLDALVSQALRYKDVERFGSEDIPRDTVEARTGQIIKRFPSEADFTAALAASQLTLEEFRTIVKRQLQVEAYIQERFSPMIFIPNEDIETFYKGTWSMQRRQRGLPVPPLDDVREEIRTLLKSTQLQAEIDRWTAQLRARANVDVFAIR
jgi:tRNA isopentenyl-2-thiomethyl-A-37 hydroxylase MiaE